ncbi:MAG TPA: glycosyltransferase, partial [Candidatus Acidoferrales bacterium]
MARLPWLSDVAPADTQDSPPVSIIFAARDEAEKLPAAIATLLAQDYPCFEVVAVNDRSTDQTPVILHDLQKTAQ